MDDAPLIKRTEGLETPFSFETMLDIPGDPAAHLLSWLYFEHDLYAIEMAANRPEIARERIKRPFPAWVAYRDEIAYTADETFDSNSLVGFICLSPDDPDFLEHCSGVRIAVEAHRT
jgi:hypothetical protein